MNPVEPIRDLAKVESIKRTLRKRSPRDSLLFTLGINTALRVGDLLRLRARHVLDENGKALESLSLREQKTRKYRTVKINAAAAEAIERYAQEVNPEPNDLLFSNPRTGKAISRVQVWRLLNQWAKEAGISSGKIGAHTMRKTWGYQARMQGVPVELIQQKFGHSSPSVTKQYIGITADEVHSAEDRVNL